VIRSASKRSRTRKSVRPKEIASRSESRKLISPASARALVHPQDGEEGLLGDLDGADALHPLLPFLLLLEELALARDVPAVALGEDVLAHGPDRLAADDM